MGIGKNIKTLREARGLTQGELSELTGGLVSQGAISVLERRDSSSSRFTSVLAKALGVTVENLINGAALATTENEEINSLTPRQRALIGLFAGLTETQQQEEIRRLENTKQQNDELLGELLKRKQSNSI